MRIFMMLVFHGGNQTDHAGRNSAEWSSRSHSDFAHTRSQYRSLRFIQRIEQRLGRDRSRLQEYYRALLRDTASSKRRAAAISAEEIAAKKRAVDLELRRKLAELNENYAIKAALQPVRIPALAIPLVIQRKQAVRSYRLHWNSLLKKFEPLSCSHCRSSTFAPTFTNETVDLLCTACAQFLARRGPN